MVRRWKKRGGSGKHLVKVEASGEGEKKDLAWLSGIISSLRPCHSTDSILVVKFHAESSDEPTRIDKTERLGVHSEILIQSSPMFSKLYETASERNRGKEITLNLSSSDEAALAHMMHFVYDQSISTLPHSGLLLMDIIQLADMFEVAHCVAVACSRLLSPESPMTHKLVASCFELQPHLKCIQETEALVSTARAFLLESFRDIERYLSDPKLLNLPLSAIKAVIASDSLRVTEEDAIVRVASQWTTHHHAEEGYWCKDVWESEFSPLFRLAYTSNHTLHDLVSGCYCDPAFVAEAVFQASVFKAKVECTRRLGKEPPRTDYVDRGYDVPVDVTVIGPPMEHCSVIVRLSRSQCRSLLSNYAMEIFTRVFWFSDRQMSLRFRCDDDDRLVVVFKGCLVANGGTFVHREVAVRNLEAYGMFEQIADEEGIMKSDDQVTLPLELRVDDPYSPFFLADVLFLRLDINVIRKPQITASPQCSRT